MGTYVTIETDKILPSQDFLKVGTIRFILQCLREGNDEQLPPAPIVRHHPTNNKFVAIDGHNIIAVRDYRGEEIEVYIAESKHDRLNGNSEAVVARNADLEEKFERSVVESDRLVPQGITSFKILENQYPELFPPQ